jgi:hypothetical protein
MYAAYKDLDATIVLPSRAMYYNVHLPTGSRSTHVRFRYASTRFNEQIVLYWSTRSTTNAPIPVSPSWREFELCFALDEVN